jgi:hypothetical protein
VSLWTEKSGGQSGGGEWYRCRWLITVVSNQILRVTPNIRLSDKEMDYILEHCEPSLIMVDREYAHMVSKLQGKVEIVISDDTARVGCPYEAFLTQGREYSREAGWQGIEMVSDEMAPACVNYT